MALQLSIHNALKMYKYNHNHKTGYSKLVQIDMPFSRKAFTVFFVNKLNEEIPSPSTRISIQLTVENLQQVFGENWYIMKNSKPSSQQRILGMVSILFRCKMSSQDRSIG